MIYLQLKKWWFSIATLNCPWDPEGTWSLYWNECRDSMTVRMIMVEKMARVQTNIIYIIIYQNHNHNSMRCHELSFRLKHDDDTFSQQRQVTSPQALPPAICSGTGSDSPQGCCSAAAAAAGCWAALLSPRGVQGSQGPWPRDAWRWVVVTVTTTGSAGMIWED